MYFPPLLFPKLCGRHISIHALLDGNKFRKYPYLPTLQELRSISELSKGGLSRIGIANFDGNPATVPLETATVTDLMASRACGLRYTASVTSVADAQRALQYGIDELCVAIEVSIIDKSSSTPIMCETAINRIEQITELSRGSATVNLFILGAFGSSLCPWIREDHILDLGDYFWNFGVDTITLCDQEGTAHPVQVERLCDGLIDRWVGTEVSLYFKNAHGIGLANVIAAMAAGICSYVVDAARSDSDIATKNPLPDIKLADFLYLLEGLNCMTGSSQPPPPTESSLLFMGGESAATSKSSKHSSS